MAEAEGPSVHATALLYDGRGLVLRGASGAGKSRLALALLDDAAARGLDAALVGDDRVILAAQGGRLVARALDGMAGRIELRGVGLVARPFEPAAVVALVIDLGAATPPRWPEPETRRTVIAGIEVAHLGLRGDDPDAVLRVRSALAGDVI